jgi:nitroimidazol reductase NimA-like FMN-containing flavoprotein (pyridoxamine 5'-phosphate oxidase superfamily)
MDDVTQNRGYLRELSEEDCYALLSTGTVGRLAFTNAQGLQLIPVNFVVSDGIVYFRTSEASVLADLAEGSHEVAFGVDYRDDLYQTGWSVTVNGSTHAAEEEPVELPRPWAPGKRDLVIALTPRQITGRKVRRK